MGWHPPPETILCCHRALVRRRWTFPGPLLHPWVDRRRSRAHGRGVGTVGIGDEPAIDRRHRRLQRRGGQHGCHGAYRRAGDRPQRGQVAEAAGRLRLPRPTQPLSTEGPGSLRQSLPLGHCHGAVRGARRPSRMARGAPLAPSARGPRRVPSVADVTQRRSVGAARSRRSAPRQQSDGGRVGGVEPTDAHGCSRTGITPKAE